MRTAVLASLWLVCLAICACIAFDSARAADRSVPTRSPDRHRDDYQNDRYSPDLTVRPVLSDGHPAEFLHGQVVGRGAARTDTVYLLGGPGSLTGKFQTASGAPDRQGWIGVDLTIPDGPYWHIDTYHCGNLDTETIPNHAWWCGRYFQDDCGSGDNGGYGNNWQQILEWYGAVPDPTVGVTVRIAAVLNHDVELNCDYLYLQVESMGDWQDLIIFNDIGVGLTVDTSFSLTPADFLGDDTDQVHLRWYFESDGGWSDEDCSYTSQGAAQIDLIEVFFDQGGGEIQVGVTETCEPSDPLQWAASVPTGVGDFSKVWPLLHDIDPCRSNSTPQFAFIDDGNVVPGTGGYMCTTWCYGPLGYIVNPEGGLAGPDHHLNNRIYSPVLPWPGPNYDGMELRFEVFRHENLSTDSPGIGDIWHVRSTASDDPADIEYAGWMDRDSGLTYGGPAYLRYHRPVSDLIEPARKYVQVALGAWQWGWVYGFTGTDGYPAPYFDNVAVVAYEFGGPSIHTSEYDLAQDSFPASGTIDYANLGNNSVRFDMAQNISPPDHMRNDPGDSLILDIAPIRTGSVLNDLPKLHYRLNPNPVFDPYRTSGLPNAGWVYGDSTYRTNGSIIRDQWNFDLPDTGFFYPGDVIHYYLEAQDNLGGDIATTRLPGDTTGFSDFEEFTHYPSTFIVRALPSLRSFTPGDQPSILFWEDHDHFNRYGVQTNTTNDRHHRRGEEEWRFALRNLGYLEGIDYDLYYTNAPTTGVGNGLGGRATTAQLNHYDVLLYTCGDLSNFTISNGDFNRDAGNDIGVLDSWLRLGGKDMFLTGDHLVFDLWNNGGSATQAFVNDWLSVSFVSQDVLGLIGSQRAPTVKVVSGNTVFTGVEEWLAYKSCSFTNYYPSLTFDAVEAVGTAERLAEFTDTDGNSDIYSYSAATLNYVADYDVNVISLPYDLMFVYTSSGGGDGLTRATRSWLLEEVLTYFGMLPSGQPVDVPAAGEFTVRTYPNPFNPSTKIAYNLPRRGELSVKVYNLRGELVTTLLDEVRPAGSGYLIWDGTDAAGGAVASGVYFVESVAGDRRSVLKTALVK